MIRVALTITTAAFTAIAAASLASTPTQTVYVGATVFAALMFVASLTIRS